MGKKRIFDPAKHCGAKTRSGEPCTQGRVPGRTRCKFHGGMTPKGIQNAKTHGLYCKELSPTEKDQYDDVTVGSIDEEIRVFKLKFARALRAQKRWDEEHKLETVEEVDEVNVSDSGRGSTATARHKKQIRRKEDFSIEIRKYGKLIIEAEAKRAAILELSRGEGTYERTIREFREFADAALATLPGPVHIDKTGDDTLPDIDDTEMDAAEADSGAA